MKCSLCKTVYGGAEMGEKLLYLYCISFIVMNMNEFSCECSEK